MRIVLDLSDKDLRYFRGCLAKVRDGKLAADEEKVLSNAAGLMREVTEAEAPEFVQERFRRLQLLVAMLEDEEWNLVGVDRRRILNVLAYFVDPDDLIPDRIPGLGYLDDAIMVELVIQELRHEIQAYQKFCDFRGQKPREPGEVQKTRASLQARMRRSRRRERDARRAKRPGRSPLGLW